MQAARSIASAMTVRVVDERPDSTMTSEKLAAVFAIVRRGMEPRTQSDSHPHGRW